MKQLQKQFTTSEQSKRLLELGVPADSADCYYDLTAGDMPYWRDKENDNINLFSFSFIKPCWSVGRLIELLVASAIDKDYVECIIKDITKYTAPVETYVNVITYLYKKKELDFQKLED